MEISNNYPDPSISDLGTPCECASRVPVGRRGHARIGNTYATKSFHTKDDASRGRTAPESNRSRSQTLVTSARSSNGGSSISTSTCHWQLHRRFPLAPTARTVCSPRRKLIIELDGSQHLDQADYDAERTKHLEAKGYRVLRFWNNQVMNEIDAVLNVIWTEINK
jgi:Protein of unknown function (DUF559)